MRTTATTIPHPPVLGTETVTKIMRPRRQKKATQNKQTQPPLEGRSPDAVDIDVVFFSSHLACGAGDHRPEGHRDAHVPVGRVCGLRGEEVERRRVRRRIAPPDDVRDQARDDEGYQTSVTRKPFFRRFFFFVSGKREGETTGKKRARGSE